MRPPLTHRRAILPAMFDDAPISSAKPWVPPRLRTPPPMDHEPGAKESAFTHEMGELILLRLATGETVASITADPRMPSYATVYRWTQVVPGFGDAWREVRAKVPAMAVWADRQKALGREWRRAHERKLDGKPARGWRSGRRSTFTACMAMTICFEIEQGASLSEVVRRADRPSFRAIYRWLRNVPWFRRAYARACHLRGWMLRDQAQDLVMTYGYAARPQVDAMFGRAGRMEPRKYMFG